MSRTSVGVSLRAVLISLIFIASASAQQTTFDSNLDPQELLKTVINNSMKDIRALRNFVFQQKVSTDSGSLASYPRPRQHTEELTETVIADGKVFARRLSVDQKDSPSPPITADDVARAPAFDAMSVFGPGVPFGEIPGYFDVVSIKTKAGETAISLKRNKTAGTIPSFRIQLVIDSATLRVTSATYDLTKPTSRFIDEHIRCTFVNDRGYWLPKELHIFGKPNFTTYVTRNNEITYKSFQVSSRILQDKE